MGGSGFFVGLLVSVFSKTLVLLAGIGMVLIQVRLARLMHSPSPPLKVNQPWLMQTVHLLTPYLVLLVGRFGLPFCQVAARNGIDLVSTLKLKERANTSRILAMLNQHTAFKLSFAIAFALSAFMSF